MISLIEMVFVVKILRSKSIIHGHMMLDLNNSIYGSIDNLVIVQYNDK